MWTSSTGSIFRILVFSHFSILSFLILLNMWTTGTGLIFLIFSFFHSLCFHFKFFSKCGQAAKVQFYFSRFQFFLICGQPAQVKFFSNFDVFIFQFFSIFRQPAQVEFSQTSRKYDRLRKKICFPKKWNLFRCSFEKVLHRCNIEPERKCVKKQPDQKSLGLETQIWKDGSILDTAVRGVDYQFVYRWVLIQARRMWQKWHD